MLPIVAALAGSYLVGGAPTAILFGKLLRGIDVREFGSRNAGATNVWRVLGAGPAITVLLIDAAKGVGAVLIVSRLAAAAPLPLDTLQVLCGLMAIVGHVWTPYARFRGGKGVGTAAGVFGALAPIALATALAVFIVVVSTTRYISAGSISAAVTIPLTMAVQYFVAPASMPLATLAIGCVVGVLVVVKHRPNISRIMNGTENRFGKPSTAAPEAASVADSQGEST